MRLHTFLGSHIIAQFSPDTTSVCSAVIGELKALTSQTLPEEFEEPIETLAEVVQGMVLALASLRYDRSQLGVCSRSMVSMRGLKKS
jgi:hypothetical protein